MILAVFSTTVKYVQIKENMHYYRGQISSQWEFKQILLNKKLKIF